MVKAREGTNRDLKGLKHHNQRFKGNESLVMPKGGCMVKNGFVLLFSTILLCIVPANALAITTAQPAGDSELVYDDGDPEGGVLLALGQIAAVRMTPPAGSWMLKTVRYYLYQGEGKVRIFADAGGTPGSDLISGFNIIPTGAGWFDADLGVYNITVAGEFYVGIEGVDGYTPCSVGHDFLAGGNGRAWDYYPGRGWMLFPDLTYFIRAVVTDRTATDEEPVPRPSEVRCEPNPFSYSTRISCILPEPGRVRVSVWDGSGRLMTGLLDAEAAAGVHSFEWTGTNNCGNKLPEGVYFLKIDTERSTQIEKVVLVH